jgi:hypothetical protein
MTGWKRKFPSRAPFLDIPDYLQCDTGNLPPCFLLVAYREILHKPVFHFTHVDGLASRQLGDKRSTIDGVHSFVA